MLLSDKDVSSFIEEFDPVFDGRLKTYYSYSRTVSLAHFHSVIKANNLEVQDSLGIVSGSLDEPELKLLKSTKTLVLDFPEFDLMEDWSLTHPDLKNKFTFTMCNQVLEHVPNPHLAFNNLVFCTQPGGTIYVSIPTINAIHGEPYFFSSGFHPRFLQYLADTHHVKLLDLGWWGSTKYLLHAVFGHWYTYTQLRRGPHLTLGDFLFPLQMLLDGTKRSDSLITDCWGTFSKCS